MNHGKKYIEKDKLVEKEKQYTIPEAAALLKKCTYAKFDETIDLAIRLGTDPKKGDQNVRGTIVLPAGTGKKIRIVVLTRGEKYKEAQEAGADFVGAEDLIDKILGGWLDFDLILATPDIMPMVGKLGKALGRKGLMPNPKAGTVTQDIAKAVKEFKAGKLEFKPDKSGVIHLGIGKMSFNENDIAKNISIILETINRARPSGFKGQLLKSVFVSSTMGPGIKIDISKSLKDSKDMDE